MISIDESNSTYEYPNYYKILPPINNWQNDHLRVKDGNKVADGFKYSSDNNSLWMNKTDFELILSELVKKK